MPHSLLNTNLQLLDGKLQELRDTAYFDQRVLRYIGSLRQIIAKLIDPTIALDDAIRIFVAMQVWSATEFIAGSAPRLQPYEMVYGLQCAVREWFAAQKHGGVKPPLIVTSLVQEPNFFFKSINPNFDAVLQAHLGTSIEYEIVQIKLPDVYRRKPLYTVALYHELGHFMDTRFAISENVEVLRPDLALPGMSAPAGTLTLAQKQVRLLHLREYFADLFAVCYCGSAIKRFLEGFAPHGGPSPTHPATYFRIQVVQALLEGKSHALVDAFNLALNARAQPPLQLRFSRPPLDGSFDAIRPAPITSDAEVHGILDAAWGYLDRAAERQAEPWKSLDDLEIERVINDLVEKSIRNRMVLEQWTRETAEAG
jgi:hypothetical protein